MEKITFKLGDILQLESEINGYTNPQDGTKVYEGFIKQNLSIILKYELKELGETLKSERNKVESLRDELIRKYGEVNEKGELRVMMYDDIKDENGNVISMKFNDKYLEFDKEYSTLLDQEKEIEYPEITKDDLKKAGDTKDDYQLLFKLIKRN